VKFVDVGTALHFEKSEDDVHAAGLQIARVFEHLVGFANTCGVTEIYLQAASSFVAHGRLSL
jgi:hypothetical protein